MSGILDAITGSDDPSTEDANGLTQAQRRQVAFNTVGSIGAQLLAAGQNIMPAQRAQLLAGLGNVPGQMQEQIGQMARNKLLATQTVQQKQKATQQAELAKYMATPEFAQQISTLPPELQAAAAAAAKGGDIGTLTKLLADNSRDVRQDKLFTQQQTLADRRAQQQLAHDDKKPISLGNGAFLDRSTGMVHTMDPLTGQLTSQPVAPQPAPSLNVAPPPAAGPVPQMAPQTAPQPSPLSPAQSAIVRPPMAMGPPVPPQVAQAAPEQPPQPDAIDPKAVEALGVTVAPPADLPAAGARNDKVLENLLPQYRGMVKAMVDGRMSPPNGMALRNPVMQRLLSVAQQYDPTFDATNWGARSATAKDFAAGASAKNITSLNTAIQHLGTLHELGQKLNNGSFPMLNQAGNYANTQTGDARATNFEATKHAVAEEVSKVFKGSNLSDSEIKQWSSALNASMSPEQLQGAVENIVELMNGRISALGDQYGRGMGASVPGIKLLDQKSRDKLDFIQSHKIGGDWKPGEKAASPQGEQVLGKTKDGREVYLGADGKKYVR